MASKTGKGPIKTANKPRAPTTPDKFTPTQLNKEVFSVQKELYENYKQQNTRTLLTSKILGWKLDAMYKYEDSENYGIDNYEGLYNNDLAQNNSECDTDAVIEPSPAKNQKTEDGPIFKSLSDKFQSLESVASAKDEELAEFVDGSFQSGITEDKQTEFVKAIHLPVSS